MTTATLPEGLHAGWYLLALTPELDSEITPLSVGARALMVVRDDADRVRVFDAYCPHRGAHLGYGGKLVDGCVICPFHRRRIRLGTGAGRMSVREYPALRCGAAVFVRLADSPGDERGFERVMRELNERRPLVAAVTQAVRVPTDLVVENAFDVDHFGPVHGVPRTIGMHISPGESGALVIEGEFETRVPPWQRPAGGVVRSRFLARAFSPSVVVTELGAEGAAHTVVTGATPTADGSIVRIAIGVAGGEPATIDGLVTGARRAITQDAAVWDHLNLSRAAQLDFRDRQVIAFRQFCAAFAAIGADPGLPPPAAGPAAGVAGQVAAGPTAGPAAGVAAGPAAGVAAGAAGR
jgi:3-ketosteroid 9alpha-monooxygenase subunit A